MTPIYAIGDIHGQKDMLDRALSLIATDGGPDAHVVFLGDYTDRGPDSLAVVQTLIEGKSTGRNWTLLKGNHDRLFSNFVRHGIAHDARIKSGLSWLNSRLGGENTLKSYGIDGQMHFDPHSPPQLERLAHFEGPTGWTDKAGLHLLAQRAVPTAHLDFLDGLPLTFETDDLIFVHAGLRPGIAINDQDIEDLIWIRDGFLDSKHDFGKLVVHGHTAIDYPAHFGNRIDLDGGAGYGRPLVPAVFEGRECWLLTGQGRVALTSD
ncbi:metallophosphoesterase family protein [Yoonia sediminilitoris]|uniref:Serine/threonine protein phosphatase 1 n=1 Tax=Yoonia sediminilitoris TaxID=1286148 RepID=A0A2T6KK47_9RHOB|nr:metallophosphoesterase family protein [Yoonia sediminilitoris]PUB16340.1 serine/threonine protein phosphatase 1 [Yoonia sediminilitoris]RCW96689.1 serine/threonine protein phosphatase 1 [Yoonia sediminilitoris]